MSTRGRGGIEPVETDPGALEPDAFGRTRGGVANGSPGRIELDGLVKSFHGPDGPIRAVRGIDVQIAAGETVALLGPNGAGKSTTSDMLLGLLAPDEGSVSVFGRPPSQAVADGAV